MNFESKNILITGASGGVGAATATMLAAKGARIALHYHKNIVKAEEVLKKLPANKHQLFHADLSDANSGFDLVGRVIESLGGLDIVVNNAGIYQEHHQLTTPFDEFSAIWEKTINLCLKAPAYISYAAARHMTKNGGGKIINISSRGAFRGEPTATAYGAAKAGLNSISQSMAKALASEKIFVYAVAPGFIETEMVGYLLDGKDAEFYKNQSPLGRFSKPEEIAETIVFLASKNTDYLTGSIIDINGASYLRS